MLRPVLLFALLTTACEQTANLVDPGLLCVGERPWQSDIDLAVGQPIPLVIAVSTGCERAEVVSECMVDIQGNDAIISSVVDITRPGRLPWDGHNLCAGYVHVPCEMPPAPKGVTVVRYGEGVMALTVPSTHTQCIEATLWTPPD